MCLLVVTHIGTVKKGLCFFAGTIKKAMAERRWPVHHAAVSKARPVRKESVHVAPRALFVESGASCTERGASKPHLVQRAACRQCGFWRPSLVQKEASAYVEVNSERQAYGAARQGPRFLLLRLWDARAYV